MLNIQSKEYFFVLSLHRNHLHPYITILTNHPSYGMILLDQVQLLLERIYNSTNLDLDSILHLLKPFLAFVLGDPRSVTSHYVKFKLQAILLQSVAQEISKDGMNVVFDECNLFAFFNATFNFFNFILL